MLYAWRTPKPSTEAVTYYAVDMHVAGIKWRCNQYQVPESYTKTVPGSYYERMRLIVLTVPIK